MLKIFLYVIILLLGVPVGLYLSYVCKEELKAWRKRFLILSIICLILIFLVSLMDFSYKIPSLLSLFFIIIVFLTIFYKANEINFNKKIFSLLFRKHMRNTQKTSVYYKSFKNKKNNKREIFIY